MSKKKDTSWGKVAGWYEGMVGDEDSYQNKVILPNLERLMQLGPTDRVLDLACGSGFFAAEFAKICSVHGVDASKELIDLAKKSHPDIYFNVALADDLSIFSAQTFNKAAIILAVQNIAPVKSMLAELKRVLVPKGRIYIVMNHPAFRIPKRSSWQWDPSLGQGETQYRRIDGYLHESKEEIEMHPGEKASQKTVSFHRPLQYYFKLFNTEGFAVTRLEEWISHKKSQPGARQSEEDRMRSEIPLFLFLELAIY